MKNKFFIYTLIFILVTSVLTLNYYFKNKEFMSTYVAELNTLDSQIESNEQQLKDLNADLSYQSSSAFVEKIAREKLGLVMQDEIIFIEEQN